jgi:hypothetical protein
VLDHRIRVGRRATCIAVLLVVAAPASAACADAPSGPVPLEVARRVIEGLRADDILRVDGYPEQEGGAVIVIREGAVVGRYGISRFEGEPWTITSGSACEGTGLPFEGESYG